MLSRVHKEVYSVPRSHESSYTQLTVQRLWVICRNYIVGILISKLFVHKHHDTAGQPTLMMHDSRLLHENLTYPGQRRRCFGLFGDCSVEGVLTSAGPTAPQQIGSTATDCITAADSAIALQLQFGQELTTAQ